MRIVRGAMAAAGAVLLAAGCGGGSSLRSGDSVSTTRADSPDTSFESDTKVALDPTACNADVRTVIEEATGWTVTSESVNLSDGTSGCSYVAKGVAAVEGYADPMVEVSFLPPAASSPAVFIDAMTTGSESVCESTSTFNVHVCEITGSGTSAARLLVVATGTDGEQEAVIGFAADGGLVHVLVVSTVAEHSAPELVLLAREIQSAFEAR